MTRPSAGKSGTDGCFLVEVLHSADSSRAIARRFHTEEEGRDFHTRTVNAHQQKANRERVGFLVVLYRTATPKTPPTDKDVLVTEAVNPH